MCFIYIFIIFLSINYFLFTAISAFGLMTLTQTPKQQLTVGTM